MMIDQAVLDFRPLADDQAIYRADRANGPSLFYAPGYLVSVRAEYSERFADHVLSAEPPRWTAAEALRRHAADARSAWETLHTRDFAPACLTLYLNNECNLRCQYCYAEPSPKRARRLNPEIVASAADIVARNCRDAGQPFTVVFHGGGEPALDQAYAEAILERVEQVAGVYHLPVFRYIATNGVMPAARAAWLARRFDMIGLSCDGPAAIQNAQRPTWGGTETSAMVERTADVIRGAGKALHVRVTVTRQSLARQPEIARYLCQRIRPAEIHVEPVYRAGRGSDVLLEDAAAFVQAFTEARRIAGDYGVPWLNSGSRPGDIHGPYCHIFRNVLQVIPGEAATACFKNTDGDEAQALGLKIGGVDAAENFVIHDERMALLREKLRREPAACQSCFNRYHCVRACPEFCPMEGDGHIQGFRCQVQQMLTRALLQEVADKMRFLPHADGVAGQTISAR